MAPKRRATWFVIILREGSVVGRRHRIGIAPVDLKLRVAILVV